MDTERKKEILHREIKAHNRQFQIEQWNTEPPENKWATFAQLGVYIALFIPFVVVEFLGVFWRHGFFDNETLSETIHRLELIAPRWVRFVVAGVIWLFGTWLALHLGFDWPV